jgi:hypothetical protein
MLNEKTSLCHFAFFLHLDHSIVGSVTDPVCNHAMIVMSTVFQNSVSKYHFYNHLKHPFFKYLGRFFVLTVNFVMTQLMNRLWPSGL